MTATRRRRRTALQALGILVTMMAITIGTPPAWAGGVLCRAQGVLAEEDVVWRDSVEALRTTGPQALTAMLEAIERDPDLAADPSRWSDRLDAVCGMKDCADARLFWYTDLDAALKQARATGRPVLSLRLLGRLDEELSCANSRLFRLALYSKPDISETLRGGWVLHWNTVREVPTVTVRFGADRAGGERRLEGTITGNSIHYVLDTRGRIVDALPGLYGPGAFVEALAVAGARAIEASDEADSEFVIAQREYHGSHARATRKMLETDLERLGYSRLETLVVAVNRRGNSEQRNQIREFARRSAADAAWRAATKAQIETEVLKAVVLDPGSPGASGPTIDWPALGRLHGEWADPIPIDTKLLERLLPLGANQGLALATLRNLFLADTARNELMLRPVLRRWLADSTPKRDLEAFDERVYADLFLTPLSDPWLGLSPENLYTALRPVRADSTGHAGMNPDAN